MSEEKKAQFAEVHAHTPARGKKGRWIGFGTSVEDPDVKTVKRALRARDYRRFLEAIEPVAMRVIEKALRSDKVPAREKLQAAQDLLNRLHGKAMGPSEAIEARKKVEAMGVDELQDYARSLARDAGLDLSNDSKVN